MLLILAVVFRLIPLIYLVWTCLFDDYSMISNEPKYFIERLVVCVQAPKFITLVFLYFQHLIYFEMHYRAYFDKYELQRQIPFTKKPVAQILLAVFGLMLGAGYLTVVYLYYYRYVQLLVLLFASIGIYFIFTFVFVMVRVVKNSQFTGCTFLNNQAKERIAIFRRRIRLWNIGFFLDFVMYLLMVADTDFHTEDLIRYLQGDGFLCKLLRYIRFEALSLHFDKYTTS